MTTYEKHYLGGSSTVLGAGVNGEPVNISINSTIHSIYLSNTDIDEVWLYGYNSSSSTITFDLYLDYNSGVWVPITQVSLSAKETKLILPGFIAGRDAVNDTTTLITAQNISASGVYVYGYVNRITP